MLSPHRRAETIDALRRGTVPKNGLDALAVGFGRFQATLDQELDAVATGRGTFKAVCGEYGSGKTFFGRWLQERARSRGFATSEVQISETETPLHRMETVYRRLIERVATADSGERRVSGHHRRLVLRVGAERAGRGHPRSCRMPRSAPRNGVGRSRPLRRTATALSLPRAP